MGRWARLAMTLVVTSAVVVAVLTVTTRPSATPTELVTVQPGDSLASIVARDMPGWDVARAMTAVAALNDIDGSSVTVGTVLRIPRTG